jgi:5-methylcytosine-specific restriction protein A
MNDYFQDNYGSKIAQELSKKLDIYLEPVVQIVSGGSFSGFRFADVLKPNGITFLVTNTPSRIQVEAELESYARELLSDMSVAQENDYFVWDAITEQSSKEGFEILLEINGHYATSPRNEDNDPWHGFALEVRKRIDRNCDPFERWNQTLKVAETCAALVMSLLPLEEIQASDDFLGDEAMLAELGEVEGAKTLRMINSYERSRKNRSACISIYGMACFVCEIDFAAKYGARGQGYIEVHHREPVSMMNSPRALSPRDDLVPVCSNCHRMLHRTWPPASPEELKEVLIDASKTS